MSILTIEHLNYSYDNGKTPVLKDINFEFEKGKTYSIVGKSGSGKTTLLSLMSGLENSKSGKILYDGSDIAKIDREKYRSQNIGVIFQSFNLLPHLTALENVVLSMDVAGMKLNDKKKHALDILEKVGLNAEKAGRRVLKLSGGEQQRVAIARALSYNPDIILADEPTGNLDGGTEAEVMKILKGLAANDNKCVIIVTHSPNVSKNTDCVYSLEPIAI
ncbi:MAG TPA: ABC transporter ATP-binding protein [Clostridia bacterium]|nr:ABC transporter ATP-binding protein [Clostridia bacterium]